MRPIFALLPFLMAPASEHGDAGGGSAADKPLDAAEALKQIEDRTLPMSQRIGVAINALKGIDPTQQLAAIKLQLTEANSTIAARDASLATASTDLTAARARITALETDVTTLEASNAALEKSNAALAAKEQDIQKRADATAKERIAALGIAASKLPGEQSSQESTSTADEQIASLRAEIAKTKDPKEKGALVLKIRAITQAASAN